MLVRRCDESVRTVMEDIKTQPDPRLRFPWPLLAVAGVDAIALLMIPCLRAND
jgi:hypothetical protein